MEDILDIHLRPAGTSRAIIHKFLSLYVWIQLSISSSVLPLQDTAGVSKQRLEWRRAALGDSPCGGSSFIPADFYPVSFPQGALGPAGPPGPAVSTSQSSSCAENVEYCAKATTKRGWEALYPKQKDQSLNEWIYCLKCLNMYVWSVLVTQTWFYPLRCSKSKPAWDTDWLIKCHHNY